MQEEDSTHSALVFVLSLGKDSDVQVVIEEEMLSDEQLARELNKLEKKLERKGRPWVREEESKKGRRKEKRRKHSSSTSSSSD